MQRTTQIAVVAVAIAAVAALLAYPMMVSAVPTSPNDRSAFQSGAPYTASQPMGQNFHGFALMQGRGGPPFAFSNHAQNQVSLKVGQTVAVTSTEGTFRVIGSQHANGTASGALSFTVTGKLSRGYTLSITGSITVNGTKYTVSSGSAQMAPGANALSGQGTTSPTGQFLMQGMSRGSFVGSTTTLSLDFSNGTTEYSVVLTGAAQ